MTENISPFMRFSDTFDVDKMNALRVTIVGAGGIGAPSALALAKSGVKLLRIYDFDDVSDENVGPQMYGPTHVGKKKVDVLADFLKDQAPWCEVEAVGERFEGQKLDCDIMVSAVDSLQTRKLIWRRVVQSSQKPKIVVDPRMGVEVLTVFCVEPGKDDAWYAKTLEGVAVEGRCTDKATFYTGLVAGALVSRTIRSFIANEHQTCEFTLDMRYLSAFGSTQDQKR